MINLIEQLIKIYLNEEWWHTKRLTLQEAWEYFRVLLIKNNLLVKIENDEIIAYVEYWLINDEQFKRVSSGEHFDISKENICDGNICYVHTLWIKDSYRGNGVLREFKKSVENKPFEYYGGIEQKYNKRLRLKARS